MLSGLDTTLLAVFLLLLMLGMGATLDLESFRAVLRRPRMLAIGLASQFGWMPPIALGTAWSCGLDDRAATGLVIMGCSSGGTTSNFFSYLSRADLALSISMTVTSTIAGVLMVPVVLWLYTQPFRSPDLAIPYASIATTLFAMLVPVAAGIGLRTRSSVWARRAERVGTVSGFGVLALVIVGSTIREGSRLLEIEPAVYLAATLLGPIGFGLGWLGAWLLGLGERQRRAVSLETGIQNAPLALGIVMLSFPEDVASDVLMAPALYGVIVVPLSALAAALYRARTAS